MIKQINCAVCSGKAILDEYESDIYIDRIKKIIKFKMINYKCHICGECFTTTESDSIIVNRINIQIRKEERKSKTSKLLYKKK